jgi:hypothetical protein
VVFVADASGWGLLKWNGSSLADIVPPESASATDKNGLLTFAINGKDVGGPKLLGFDVLTTSNGSTVEEQAPEASLPGGFAFYELGISSRVTPTLQGTVTVRRAKPGAVFTVTLNYARSDSADPTTGPPSGKALTCNASVSGKVRRLRTGQSVGAIVLCSWTLPKKSRGRYVKGSVGVSFASASWATLTKKFAKKIG